ncbi:MAG: polysaccharide deacetylase family protein [Chloroflexi bacterium]|nr:polysaccharide deacetylase family protein [Chloroflexota bacterium]
MANADKNTGSVLSRRQFMRIAAGLASGTILGGGLSTLAHSGDRKVSSTASRARVIRHVHTNERKICLSFDDMWSEFYALRICRDYHRLNIPLTLFPVGLAVRNNLVRPHEGYENMYARIRDMGHEFGCHLHTHRDIRDFSLQQLIDEEMEPSLQVMRRALGSDFKPIGIRPPYGVVTDALKELSVKYGFPLILWGLDSQDSICTSNCKDDSPDDCATTNEIYSSIWIQDLYGALCPKSSCEDRCVDVILKSYETYMRPGTIILHHVLKASYLAIKPTVAFLRDWNLQPVRLSELLTYG